MRRGTMVAVLLFLALSSDLASVADAATLGKSRGLTAKTVAFVHSLEDVAAEGVVAVRSSMKRASARSALAQKKISYRHLAAVDELKTWAKAILTTPIADLEEEGMFFDKDNTDESNWHSDYKNLLSESKNDGELTEHEAEIKEKADAVALKKNKSKGYMFLLLCVVICSISGAIGFAVENSYQERLLTKWKQTYKTDGCEPDVDNPNNPRWICPKSMTFGEFSSGGDAANVALIPIMSGMASGLVFGFIDNAGLFFGMSLLDDLLPKSMPKMLGGTGKANENVYAGMGNTFSDLIGAFLGTFCGRLVQISPSIEYDGGYPPFVEAFGMFFGCLLGVLIPHIIQGDLDKKEAIAAEKLAREIMSDPAQEKLDECLTMFQILDCPAEDDPEFGKDKDCMDAQGAPVQGKGDPEKPGQVNVNILVKATAEKFDSRLIKADKIGSNDGFVSKAEIINVLSLEYLELACYKVTKIKEGSKFEGIFAPLVADVAKTEECKAKAYDTVYG